MSSRRTARRRPRSLRRALGLLLLVNIVPLAALAVLAVLYMKGEIIIDQEAVPEGLAANLAWLGGTVVALFLVASFSLPAAHDGARAMRAAMRRGRDVLVGREEGSRLLAVLAWPFQFLLWALAALARTIFIVISLALIALLVLFLCRLWWPHLAQEQMDAVLDWLKAQAS